MIADAHPPEKKFILSAMGISPFILANGMANIRLQYQCQHCRKTGHLDHQQSMGGCLLLSANQLRELFETVGTQISIAQKDVLAGAKIKDIGELVVEWCYSAEIGEVRDIMGLHCTISRVADDLEAVGRIELQAAKPALRLVGVG